MTYDIICPLCNEFEKLFERSQGLTKGQEEQYAIHLRDAHGMYR